MAEIKVDDLVKSIREAPKLAKANSVGSYMPAASNSELIDQIQSNLAVAGRARDQLPPLNVTRHGFLGRCELWLKRRLKRASRWFTWEQVNFNSAIYMAFKTTVTALASHERLLGQVATEDSKVESRPDSQLQRVESRLAALEAKLDATLNAQREQLLSEQRQQLTMILDEQRVCFKQLIREVEEEAAKVRRTQQQLQSQLDELASKMSDKL